MREIYPRGLGNLIGAGTAGTPLRGEYPGTEAGPAVLSTGQYRAVPTRRAQVNTGIPQYRGQYRAGTEGVRQPVLAECQTPAHGPPNSTDQGQAVPRAYACARAHRDLVSVGEST